MQAGIQLRWPTDYYVVTQAFNANPELHAIRNLPGHEGLDIRAPLNSTVYACAAGEVIEVHDGRENNPYGRHITISHANGYRTTYGHLSKVIANRGQKVKTADQIALAGPTGQTGGGHIHLTLKHDGASAAGQTHFPEDIVDPTPFLSPPPTQDTAHYSWPLARCLLGATAPSGARWADANLISVKQNGMEAVKISQETTQSQIAMLKQINPAFFIMGQLRLPSDGKPVAPSDWFARLRPAFKEQVDAGIGYFEIGQMPNVFAHGAYSNWATGAEFGNWWLDAVNLLKAEAPQTKFGIPAPAAGPSIIGERIDAQAFLESADEMMLSADWIGVTEIGPEPYYPTIRRYYPLQVLFITQLVQSNRDFQSLFKDIGNVAGVGAIFSA
jgi:hypothetical protein